MNCCSKLTWQPWNNDVKYALCVSNMPNAVPSFEQLPASSKPPLWNPNNFSFLSTPCVWHTHTLSSRSKFKFWMLITFSIPYQKNDTKWPKMKKTLFSFDRLTEKINAKPTLYSETSSWFITDILQNRKCVISFCPNLSSRIQADLFKLKGNIQLPNHVCLWSQSSTLKVDVCPGLVCKLNSGTFSKYLALNKFERKIIGNSNLANNVMSLTPRYTALARLTNYLNNENN